MQRLNFYKKMVLKYRVNNARVEQSIIQWYNDVIINNSNKSIWDPSFNIHIDEVYMSFKYRWNWVDSAFYTFNYIKEKHIIDFEKFELVLSFDLDVIKSKNISRNFIDVKRIFKYINKYTPPSFYLFLKKDKFRDRMISSGLKLKTSIRYDAFLIKENYIYNDIEISSSYINFFVK